MRCWAYFQNSSILTAVIPYATPDDLNVFCSHYDYFSKCYSLVRTQCFNSIQFSKLVVYDGEDHSLGYLCVDGKNDYLSNQACFSDPSLQDECQTCKNSLTNQIDKAAQINDSVLKTSKLCQAGELYLGCINNNLKVICSQNAANWMMEYNRRSLYPLFSTFLCPGWAPTTMLPETADNKVSIILGVCLTFFCLIIVITIIVTIVYCIKTKCYVCLLQHNNPMLERGQTSNPPPYLQTVSQTVVHEIPYKSDDTESCSKSDFDTSSLRTDDYFIDEKSSKERLNDTQTEATTKSSSPPTTTSQSSPGGSKPFFLCRAFKNRCSLSDSGYSGAVYSISGNSLSSSNGTTVNNQANGSRDHTLNSHNSRESNGSNPNTSCNSTPSVHFERPVINPFTRMMSNPESTPPETCVLNDYYC